MSDISNLTEREHKIFRQKVNELDLFPGSLSEYQSLKGFQCEIMDTRRPKKFVRLETHPLIKDSSVLYELIQEGCIGLIRYETISMNPVASSNPYGIPVKQK